MTSSLDHEGQIVQAIVVSRLAEYGTLHQIRLAKESEAETNRFLGFLHPQPGGGAKAEIYLSVSLLAEQLALFGLKKNHLRESGNYIDPETFQTSVFDPAMKSLHIGQEDSSSILALLKPALFSVGP